jgi:hypothetical protein
MLSPLTKVQTEAARIVTGLTSYASLDSIYCEAGWEKLTVRREANKLNLFYIIINNEAQEYVSELILPTVAESNNYNHYSSSFCLYFFQSIRVDSSTIIPHFRSIF